MTALSNRRIRQLNRQADAVAALTVAALASGGGYVVVSGEKAYTVTADGARGLLACDCTAGSFGRACKHVAAVGQYLRDRAHDEIKAGQAAAQARDAAMVVADIDIDPAERYIARDRAAAAARGRQPWYDALDVARAGSGGGIVGFR